MKTLGPGFKRRALQVALAGTFVCANAPPAPDMRSPTDSCLRKNSGDACSYTRYEQTFGLSCYGTYKPAGTVHGTCIECPPDRCNEKLICELESKEGENK